MKVVIYFIKCLTGYFRLHKNVRRKFFLTAVLIDDGDHLPAAQVDAHQFDGDYFPEQLAADHLDDIQPDQIDPDQIYLDQIYLDQIYPEQVEAEQVPDALVQGSEFFMGKQFYIGVLSGALGVVAALGFRCTSNDELTLMDNADTSEQQIMLWNQDAETEAQNEGHCEVFALSGGENSVVSGQRFLWSQVGFFVAGSVVFGCLIWIIMSSERKNRLIIMLIISSS